MPHNGSWSTAARLQQHDCSGFAPDSLLAGNWHRKCQYSELKTDNCFDNIDSYNQAVKALIEAKLSVMTEPDQMDDIYDRSLKKEHKYNK